MINPERAAEKSSANAGEKLLEVPNTLEGMEHVLSDVFLQMDEIEAFPMGRDVQAETLKQVEYGNRILARAKEFIKHENESALSHMMKQVKKVLASKGSLNDVKNLFEKEEEEAAA